MLRILIFDHAYTPTTGGTSSYVKGTRSLHPTVRPTGSLTDNSPPAARAPSRYEQPAKDGSSGLAVLCGLLWALALAGLLVYDYYLVRPWSPFTRGEPRHSN